MEKCSNNLVDEVGKSKGEIGIFKVGTMFQLGSPY